MKTYLPEPLTPKAIQELLCVNGIGVIVSGKMDAATTRAVKVFQEGKGLLVDGVVGPKTTKALSESIQLCADLPSRCEGVKVDLPSVLCWLAEEHLALHPREVGGDNRGPWVRLFTESSDGGAWCASWATFVLQQAWDVLNRFGMTPGFSRLRYRTAWCPTIQTRARKDGRLITRAEAKADPTRVKAGMLFLVWSETKGRVSHTGIVVGDGQIDGTFETIEGNTNDDGNANGQEVARRIRLAATCEFVDLR